MCGIAGFAGRGDQADLRNMTRALSHRGPDAESLWSDSSAPVFLGHRRLSVVDLDGGSQPMWTPDGSLGVVFNGEIYNHAELRETLEARGYRFVSDHSDTEVLLHGYRQWGPDLVHHLNGMWAFAIYDRSMRRILLSRDRFGQKPLHWWRERGLFAFASELTADHTAPSHRDDNRSRRRPQVLRLRIHSVASLDLARSEKAGCGLQPDDRTSRWRPGDLEVVAFLYRT